MLVLERVTYRYAGAARPSLTDVSLELAPGEVVGLVGASEAGKTTLCLVACGLAPRTVGGSLTGRLLLDGVDVAAQPIHELAGRIGIVFSSPATQLTGVSGTVYEEIAFGPMNLGLPRAEVMARTDAAMGSLGITPLASRHPALLSGGQQQLVSIAGLLALRPSHLVLDEPTAQLDPAGTRLVGEALARLATEGASILVAEQKTDLLERIARRVVALDAGRMALEGTAQAVLADPRLDELGIAAPSAIRLRRRAAAAGIRPNAVRRLDEAIAS